MYLLELNLINSWTEERKQHIAALSRKQMAGGTAWNKGKKCPQTSGEKNGFYGKKHTPETLAKIRESWVRRKERATLQQDK